MWETDRLALAARRLVAAVRRRDQDPTPLMNAPLRTALGTRADLDETGPGTLAGRYLRRFWQPVYHAADLRPGQAVPLRVMCEDYTLYRAEGGSVHLTQARCPHRATRLSTGWVEGASIRCFYHGWKFAPDGRCAEQPAEDEASRDKVSVRTWPAREYLGLVFAYLGDGEPPVFPRYPAFEAFDGLLEIDSYLRHCNYYQNLENALDMSHVGFVHGDNRNAFEGIGLGRRLHAEESDWGVTYRFERADGQQRVQQFGMPNVFYMTALPTEPEVDWQESLFWWVPVDDGSHVQFSLHRVPVSGEAAERFKARRQQRRARIDLAHQDVCDAVLAGLVRLSDVDPARVDLVRLQDDVAQVGQGVRVDRRLERFGRSDIGVAVTRRLWVRELEALRDGRPLKDWRWSPSLVPRAWAVSPAALGAATLGHGSAAVPEVVDVRPHVEVALQRLALHGQPRQPGPAALAAASGVAWR